MTDDEMEELEQIADQNSYHPKGEGPKNKGRKIPKLGADELRARLKTAQNTYLTKKTKRK